MKKVVNFFCGVCLILSCSNNPEFFEPEISYVDYSCISQDELSQNDRILLENVDFQEGKISCSLDLKTALEMKIPENKYKYFLEYLQNENRRIESYLDSGAIVFYNGKPFTRNEELYQYVECPDQALTRATYTEGGTLFNATYRVGTSYNPTYYADFYGPSKISVSLTGAGSVTLREEYKNLFAYLINGTNQTTATFKWGFGNRVLWNWKVDYRNLNDRSGTLTFTGYYENTQPSPSDPDYERFWRNLPAYVTIYPLDPNYQSGIRILIRDTATYIAKVYKVQNEEIYPYTYDEQTCTLTGEMYVAYPRGWKFWLVIYRKVIRDGRVQNDYIGDCMLPSTYPY